MIASLVRATLQSCPKSYLASTATTVTFCFLIGMFIELLPNMKLHGLLENDTFPAVSANSY